jgi:hypothetical protein
MLPSITGVAAQEQGHERSDEEGEVDHKHAHALDGDIPHTTGGADQQHKDQDQEQDQHHHQHHQHHQHHHHLEHVTDTTHHKHNHGAITANEKENDDPNDDIKLTAELLDEAKIEEASDDVDTTIDHILNDEERTLPKDVGEINVQGHLRFDEEMPPDMETQKNTIHNALMYQITDEDDSESAGAGSSANDHIHHLKGDKGHKTITFDTYNPNIDVTHYQTTIIFQHKHFELHNTSRTFMIPFDEEKPSIDAITWALQEMVHDNDIVVVVKVVSLPFIMKNGVQAHRKNCKNLFKRVCDYNVNDVKLKIIVEIRIGAAEFALARAIKDFDPTFLVMGTKGLKKTKLTSFLTEDPSLTKHYLDNGRVPVIVVNPYYDPAQYDAIRDKQSTEEEEKKKGEHTFSKKLATYPSVYDPHNALHTMEMERAANGVAPNTSGGRTSRFLRISRTVSRGSSASSQSGLLSPTTSNDLSPVRSGSRGLSPIRAMSPFRLFHRH